MPNLRYNRGRAKEYRIVNQLKEQGYSIAQRTAGSHSQIDILAINKETKEILFIQSKPDNILQSEEENIYNKMNWLNAEQGTSGAFSVKFEVI